MTFRNHNISQPSQSINPPPRSHSPSKFIADVPTSGLPFRRSVVALSREIRTGVIWQLPSSVTVRRDRCPCDGACHMTDVWQPDTGWWGDWHKARRTAMQTRDGLGKCFHRMLHSAYFMKCLLRHNILDMIYTEIRLLKNVSCQWKCFMSLMHESHKSVKIINKLSKKC